MPSVKSRPLPRYFWVIGSLVFALYVMEGSSLNTVLSVFIKPMTEEFGWSRGTISGVATLGAFASGILGLAIGPLMDRRGVRLLTLLGVVVLGGSLASLGLVSEIWTFYAVNGLARICSLAVISVAVTVVISNWFVKRRGRAMGITYMGSRLGGSLLPILAFYLITNYGWRLAWLAIGIMTLALAIPVFMYLRHQPEDVGLLPDGASPDDMVPLEAPGAGPGEPEGEPAWTPWPAARTSALWLLAVATAQAYLGMGALNLHQVSFMTDAGIPSSQAVGTLTVSALSAAAGGFVSGALAERVHVRYVLAGSLGVSAIGMVFLVSMDSLATAYTYAVLGGLGMGGAISLSRMVWAEYYGRRSVGAIQGLVMPVQMSGNAFGPLLAGWAFDVSGSYLQVFTLLGAGYVLAAICAVLARPVKSPGCRVEGPGSRGQGLGSRV